MRRCRLKSEGERLLRLSPSDVMTTVRLHSQAENLKVRRLRVSEGLTVRRQHSALTMSKNPIIDDPIYPAARVATALLLQYVYQRVDPQFKFSSREIHFTCIMRWMELTCVHVLFIASIGLCGIRGCMRRRRSITVSPPRFGSLKKKSRIGCFSGWVLVKLTPKKTEMITHDANTDDFSSDEHSDEDVKQFVSGYDE
jgi:hypothetical protein